MRTCSLLPGRHAEGLRRLGASLREFNGEDDHVHLLDEYPPKVAVPSYFAASCGGAPLSIIWQYIEQQRHPVFEQLPGLPRP